MVAWNLSGIALRLNTSDYEYYGMLYDNNSFIKTLFIINGCHTITCSISVSMHTAQVKGEDSGERGHCWLTRFPRTITPDKMPSRSPPPTATLAPAQRPGRHSSNPGGTQAAGSSWIAAGDGVCFFGPHAMHAHLFSSDHTSTLAPRCAAQDQ